MEEKNRLERIEEAIVELTETTEGKKKKPKNFKIPITKRVKGKKARDNYVTVLKINENNQLDFKKEKIFEQTIMIDDVPRLASGEYVMYYKRNPIIIQPSWCVEPFSPKQNFKESLDKGSNIAGYRLLMNRMQTEAIKLGKKIGGLGIGIGAIVVIGIIAYALISG